MEKMKEETGTYAKRKRSLNGLTQYYQNMLTRSLLNALDNFKTEDWTMSINDATPQDWDRLRKQHPPLVLDEVTSTADLHYTPQLNPTFLEKYIALAEEELDGYDENGYALKVSKEDWDTVNNPTHYNTGNIECIEAIEESMTPEAFRGYLKGNCMKYLWRYDYKGKPVEDLQKAQWYLAKLLNVVVFEEGEE
jgi:hypothetical protein